MINTEKLTKNIRDIKILDPACGTGNFTIASYYYLMHHE